MQLTRDCCFSSSTVVHITCIPRWTSLEMRLERSLLGRLDSVLLGWTRHGRLEQVRIHRVWHDPENMRRSFVTSAFVCDSAFCLLLCLLEFETVIFNWQCSRVAKATFNETAMNNSQRKEFMSSLIICKDLYSYFLVSWTVVCSTQGQSSQLVESIGGDEWNQVGAEAALLLHTQPAVSSCAVTQLTEGKTQQPSSRPHTLFTLLKYPFQQPLDEAYHFMSVDLIHLSKLQLMFLNHLKQPSPSVQTHMLQNMNCDPKLVIFSVFIVYNM